MGHDIETRFRAARVALNNGDSGPLLDLMTEDVIWWDTGSDTPLVGREAVGTRLDELADFGIRADVHDLFANSEHLVALIHAEARNEDGTFGYSTAEIYHLSDDGRISKRQAFAHDSSEIARFFRRHPSP